MLEYVDDIRRELSSCGAAEQLAVLEGRATREQAPARSPRISAALPTLIFQPGSSRPDLPRISPEQAEVAFPLLPGSHLQMRSPALEFVKMLCHLCALDAPLQVRPLPTPSR